MRLWHKDLLPVLPRQQLLSQWRECCCIARNITVNGTPNHILVNKIMEFPLTHFRAYAYRVYIEMKQRGYKVNKECFTKYFSFYIFMSSKELFQGWHNQRYKMQCFYNLQEKYDNGGLTGREYRKLFNHVIGFEEDT